MTFKRARKPDELDSKRRRVDNNRGQKPDSRRKSHSATAPPASQKKQSIVKKAPAPASDDEEAWENVDNELQSDDGHGEMNIERQEKLNRAGPRGSKVQQKETTMLRKARDPIFPLVTVLKKRWERLRRADLPQDERATLMEEMMPVVTGNIADLIFKHDASRIIQSMVKYGTESQRKQIAEELKGRFLELSRSMYGRFITLRLLKYTSSVRSMIIDEFKGNIAKNIRHAIAGYVIESIYADYSNAREKYCLLQELYHPEFRTFKTDKPLSEIAKVHNKQHLLTNMLNVIRPCIEKGILGDFTIVQRATLDYLEFASDDERSAILESLQPELVAILHNKEGALLSMRAITHATPKERKTIAKGFKEYVMKIASEEYGHWVLLQFLDTVDDTVLTNSAIIKEFDYAQLAENKYFRKSILFCLVGRSTRHFAPVVLEALQQNGKKDAFRRYSELLQHVSPSVLDRIKVHFHDWMKDPDMGPFTVEALMRMELPHDREAERMTLVEQLGEVLRSERDGTFLRSVKALIQYHLHWHRNQEKAKVKEGYSDDGHAQLEQTLSKRNESVSSRLFSALSKGDLKDLAKGAGAFVALALCESSATGDAARSALQPFVSEIEAASAKGSAPLLAILLGEE